MKRVVALLVAASPLTAQTPEPAIPEGLLGRWAGAAIEQGTPRLFELELSLDSDGRLSTVLTLPYNGYDTFPYDFEYTPGGDYDGTLTSGLFGDEMRLVVDIEEGHLRGVVTEEDSVTARVHLQKVVGFELPPIRIEQVRFPAGLDTLAGSLYLPARGSPTPAVVLVTGRGYGSRHELSSLGRLLARKGIAALAFDGRGTGASTGDNAAATAEDRFADVHGALDLLASHDDIGPTGLLGSSAGGWVVPTVAAAREDVAFVITLVGPAESLADQQGHVTTAFMRASGDNYSEDEYAEAFEYQRQTVLLAQAHATWADFERINTPARQARWAEHALIPDSLQDADLDYFRRRKGYVAPPWSTIQAPVLAIYGENDLVVPPEVNIPILRSELAANDDVTIVVLPGADHALARPDGFAGEGEWPHRFYRSWTRSPLLFETLIDWFGERFSAPAERDP